VAPDNDGSIVTEESVRFAEPKGSIFSAEQAILHPCSFLSRVLGPRNVSLLLQVGCCFACLGIVVLAALGMSVLANWSAVMHPFQE